jgi:hypothetical protein
MVCQLRHLMYSLCLNIAPCIRFTLVKLRVKNKRCFKQAFSLCKMAEAGFHSIAKLHARIFNPVLADLGVNSAICHNKVRSLNLRADCHRPELSAWFVYRPHSGIRSALESCLPRSYYCCGNLQN